MLNYFNRFRRYLSDSIENKRDNTNEESEDDDDDENVKSQQAMLPYLESSASPVGQSRSSRHSIGGAVRKLKRSATTRTYNSGKDYLSSNAHESSEEENSTARLSRRSSVLVIILKNNIIYKLIMDLGRFVCFIP